MANPNHAKIADYVKQYMLKHATAADPVHGKRRATARYWHSLSVYRNVDEILNGEGADDQIREICEIAALFHDVDHYCVEHAYHGDRGAETAGRFLTKEGYPKPIIEGVMVAVRDHNFDFSDDLPAREQVEAINGQLPLSSRYVLDADLLDKIGASNILSAVMPMGMNNKYPSEVALIVAEGWPLERAEFWRSLLTTRTGRAMGEQRLGFYRLFVGQLKREIVLADPFMMAVKG
jgi:uncharacterized protein